MLWESRTVATRGKKAAKRRSVEERGKRLRVNGTKLRALRQDAELSIRELAFAVDVDPKTITDLEAGRREWSQLRVIRSIAAHPAINVAWQELVLQDQAPSEVDRSAPFRPVTSSLDELVHAEKRGAALPPMETSAGLLPSFGATQLVNVFSSPMASAGERFYLRGHVVAQRGLSSLDGQALGIDAVRGSRFLLARRIGKIDRPFSLTVVTITVDATKALQRAWETDHEVLLIAAVVATQLVSGGVQVFGQSSVDVIRPIEKNWRGFVQIAERDETAKPKEGRPHPWVLQVLTVEKSGEPQSQQKQHSR